MDAKTRIRNAMAKARSNAERRRLQADLDERLRAEGIDPDTCVAEVLAKVARGTLRRGDSVIATDDIARWWIHGVPQTATGVVLAVNHDDPDSDNPGLGEARVAWDGIEGTEPVPMDDLALDPEHQRPIDAAAEQARRQTRARCAREVLYEARRYREMGEPDAAADLEMLGMLIEQDHWRGVAEVDDGV